MKFKAKLFKHGNGMGIYVPKEVYTDLKEGGEYEWQVYTKKELEKLCSDAPVQLPKKFKAGW